DNLPSTSAIHPNAPQVLINSFGNNNSAPAPASDKQKLGPKNYLQSIPYFDGTAMGYDVNEFLIHCKHAKQYSSSHDELLTLLIGRLKGEALRRAGVNEKMNAYITRVQELSTDLTEILRTEDIRDKEATKRVLNNDLINGFVHGLQHKYLNRFSTVSFLDLNSAFAEGRQVDKQLTDFPQLCPNEQESFVSQINNATHLKPIYNNAENTCTFCHNYGHTIDICRKRKWQQTRDNGNTLYKSQQKPMGYSYYDTFCKYCKRNGHVIQECRTRLYNNQMRENSNRQTSYYG
ncbi:hypothetical protein PV326_000873, partial [Microctonus aethiopoides]